MHTSKPKVDSKLVKYPEIQRIVFWITRKKDNKAVHLKRKVKFNLFSILKVSTVAFYFGS